MSDFVCESCQTHNLQLMAGVPRAFGWLMPSGQYVDRITIRGAVNSGAANPVALTIRAAMGPYEPTDVTLDTMPVQLITSGGPGFHFYGSDSVEIPVQRVALSSMRVVAVTLLAIVTVEVLVSIWVDRPKRKSLFFGGS